VFIVACIALKLQFNIGCAIYKDHKKARWQQEEKEQQRTPFPIIIVISVKRKDNNNNRKKKKRRRIKLKLKKTKKKKGGGGGGNMQRRTWIFAPPSLSTFELLLKLGRLEIKG
jgi:hypothetical protein